MPDMQINSINVVNLAVELQKIPGAAPRALSSALNRTLTHAKNETKKEVLKGYEVKSRSITETLRTRKASPNYLQATLSSIGRTLTLKSFKVKPGTPPKTRKAMLKHVQVKVKKTEGYKMLKIKPGGFVQNMKGATNVFARKTSKSLPVKVLKSLSVPQMIANDKVYERIQASAQAMLDKRIEHEINYRLNQAAKKVSK